MAAAIMVKRVGKPELFDEFYQEACLAVIEAVMSYDGSKGTSERTWLTNTAKYRILDYIRVEMGRRPGSMRQHEAPFSPIHEPDNGYWSPFDVADPCGDAGYVEVDDEDERIRAMMWAVDVLEEELSEKFLVGVRAWMAYGKLKAAGESIGKTEGWICRCVREAERVLSERSDEVTGMRCATR